jgi:hypothetical protein
MGRTAGVFATYMLLVGLAFAAIVGGVLISSAPAGG